MKLFSIVVLTLAFVGTAAAGNYHPIAPYHPVVPDHPVVVDHPVVPTTPATHDCKYTGAGKDGQPGNDDCAPVTTTITVPTPPVVTTVTVYVDRVVEKLVPGPTRVVTKVVKSKPKVIVKTKLKVVKIHKIVYKYKTKKLCPPYTKLYKGICAPMGNG